MFTAKWEHLQRFALRQFFSDLFADSKVETVCLVSSVYSAYAV